MFMCVHACVRVFNDMLYDTIHVCVCARVCVCMSHGVCVCVRACRLQASPDDVLLKDSAITLPPLPNTRPPMCVQLNRIICTVVSFVWSNVMW